MAGSREFSCYSGTSYFRILETLKLDWISVIFVLFINYILDVTLVTQGKSDILSRSVICNVPTTQIEL